MGSCDIPGMEEKEDIHQHFSSFLERHRLFIWKLSNRYADGDPVVGLDYVQDITTLLWLRYGKLRAGAHPWQEQKWIGYIARDYFRSLSRKKGGHLVPYDDDLPVTPFQGNEETPSDLLAEYMICLTPPEREAVDLYVQGYKAKDIAQLLGISPTAVRLRLHHAVLRMRAYAQKIEKTNNP